VGYFIGRDGGENEEGGDLVIGLDEIRGDSPDAVHGESVCLAAN